MQKQIELEGFEGQRIEIQTGGIFTGIKLFVDGEPPRRGPKRGEMLLQKTNSDEVLAHWQPVLLGFDLPKLVVDGDAIDLVPPLKPHEVAWSALPILLIFLGGAFGALVGVLGYSNNTKVFRSERSPAVKYLLTAAISAAAGIAYLLIALVLSALLN